MSATVDGGLQQVVAGALPDAEVVRAWRLLGGISAETHALEVREAGGTRTLVVRRIGPGSLAFDPRAAEHEFAVRRAVFAAGVPTPEPLAWGDAPWPHLLLTYVEGAVEARAAPLAVTSAF